MIAWVNGHTHRNEVIAHSAAAGGFWEINTASHIDFPQQARIIEIADNLDDTLSIFTTILDHLASAEFDGGLDSIDSLASLSRELSANDPQLISSARPARRAISTSSSWSDVRRSSTAPRRATPLIRKNPNLRRRRRTTTARATMGTTRTPIPTTPTTPTTRMIRTILTTATTATRADAVARTASRTREAWT